MAGNLDLVDCAWQALYNSRSVADELRTWHGHYDNDVLSDTLRNALDQALTAGQGRCEGVEGVLRQHSSALIEYRQGVDGFVIGTTTKELALTSMSYVFVGSEFRSRAG